MDRSPDVDAFLAKLPDDLRTALEDLRRLIAAAAADAVETIAYMGAHRDALLGQAVITTDRHEGPTDG